MNFGKYLGQTYNTVWVNDPSYCQWALLTVESGDATGDGLARFAQYVATREARGPNDIPAGRMGEEL